MLCVPRGSTEEDRWTGEAEGAQRLARVASSGRWSRAPLGRLSLQPTPSLRRSRPRKASGCTRRRRGGRSTSGSRQRRRRAAKASSAGRARLIGLTSQSKVSAAQNGAPHVFSRTLRTPGPPGEPEEAPQTLAHRPQSAQTSEPQTLLQAAAGYTVSHTDLAQNLFLLSRATQ